MRRLDVVLSVRLLGAGGSDRLSHAERERAAYDGDATGQRVDRGVEQAVPFNR